MFGPPARAIFTIGHSTRTLAEFLSLLEEHRIELLVDVRHFPGSRRVPWATAAILARDLSSRGIGYVHLEALGGFRKPRPDSPNMGWRTEAFRGYADHMASPEFAAAFDRLLELAAGRRTAIMCAEAVPWKCHRSLLSDALLARGVPVTHILGTHSTQPHRMTTFAKVRGNRVGYPATRRKAV
ncbi:MAG TPA: DUF488 domain-containing protein [Thermoplasmata archaeon]|nr:DUF488 domain-containing protein [Thermoplasmata archaeon]